MFGKAIMQSISMVEQLSIHALLPISVAVIKVLLILCLTALMSLPQQQIGRHPIILGAQINPLRTIPPVNSDLSRSVGQR